MKWYILFYLLVVLPLSMVAQSTIRRDSKPKSKPKVENTKQKSKPKPKSRPKQNVGDIKQKPKSETKSRPLSTLTPQPTPQPAPQITQQQTELDKLINNMVYVSGGTFIMGEGGEQKGYSNGPAHKVSLDNFQICKYEVTQALWEVVMGNNPSGNKGDNLPVECVSWDDCQTFISRLNSLTNKTFRLPTEAEWEFAARGGKKSLGYKYSGSNNLSDVAWYNGNSDNRAHPVGLKKPNELGLYDMSGNVREWCSDWLGKYSSSDQNNPKGPSKDLFAFRVHRGGDWDTEADGCRSTDRNGVSPGNQSPCLGFRLVLSQSSLDIWIEIQKKQIREEEATLKNS